MPVFSSSGRVFRASVASTVLVLGLAACGTEVTSAHDTAGAPGTTETMLPTASGEALVNQVAIRGADLGRRGSVRLYEGGDQVKGRVTLDNCGYDFTTESHRVARRQVRVVVNRNRRVGLSNEVVAYGSPERAAEAINEFRVSVETCARRGYHVSGVQGVPDLRYLVSRHRTAPGLPIEDNTVATLAVRTKDSDRRYHQMIVFQRRGTVLTGMYLSTVSKPTPAQRAILWSLVRRTGARLATI